MDIAKAVDLLDDLFLMPKFTQWACGVPDCPSSQILVIPLPHRRACPEHLKEMIRAGEKKKTVCSVCFEMKMCFWFVAPYRMYVPATRIDLCEGCLEGLLENLPVWIMIMELKR